jgi:hypothetical protein
MYLPSRTLLLLPVWLTAACSLGSHFQSDSTVDRLGVWVPEPAATILRAEESSLHVPTFAIVVDTNAWRSIWTQAWADTAAPPRLPFEDFVLTSVIVLGLGDRVGTGYSVTIDSVVSYTSGQILFATESQPEHPCPGPAFSAPVHMVRVINHPPPMEYRLARVRRPCPP